MSEITVTVQEIKVPEIQTPDEAAKFANDAADAADISGCEGYAAAGLAISQQKTRLEHGEFKPWCERHFSHRWKHSQINKLMKFSAWYYKNKKGLKLLNAKVSATTLVTLSNSKLKGEHYDSIVKRLKKGELVVTKDITEARKEQKEKERLANLYDKDGLAQCTGCDNWFKKDGFHDPNTALSCHSCHKEQEEQLEREKQEAKEEPEENSLAAIWAEASEEDKQALLQVIAASGYGTPPPEEEEEQSEEVDWDALEAEVADVEPYEEVIHWWNKCDDTDRKKLAKKLPWAKYGQDEFIPPSAAEVENYCIQKRIDGVNAEEFVSYYESRGWTVGKTNKKMASWQRAVTTWANKKKTSGWKTPSLEDVRRYIEEDGITGVNANKFWNHYEMTGWKVGGRYVKNWKAAVRKWAATSEEEKGAEEFRS